MQKFLNLYIVTLLLLVWSVPPVQAISLVSGDYWPHSGKELPNGGLSSEIIVAAFHEVGIAVNIEFLPWKRGYQKVLNHDFFGTFPYVKDDDREALFLFSDAILTARSGLFTLSDFKINYRDEHDLKGLKTCVPLGYSVKEIQHLIDNQTLTVVTAIDDEACIAFLKLGRVHVYSMNEITAWASIQKLYGETKGFKMLNMPLTEYSYYLMVAKDHPDSRAILGQFNEGLKLIKENGRYQKIINKHLGPNF